MMRRIRVSVATGVAAVAFLLPISSARALSRGDRVDWPALRTAESIYARFHAEAIARGLEAQLHPAAAPAGAIPGSLDAFGTVRHAEQISRDNAPNEEGSEPDTQIEPDIAVDPNNPKDVVAVFQQGRYPDGGSVDPGYSTSLDGGKTWKDGNLPNLTIPVGGKTYDRASDPAVAFGPGGVAYAVTLTINFATASSGVAVQRSTDGGVHWSDPFFAQEDLQAGGILNDKEWITVDTFPKSPHFGRVYVAWDRAQNGSMPIVERYSDDRGKTWSKLIQVSPTSGIGAIPLVRPNGNVTIVYDGGPYYAQTSKDGGATWGSRVFIESDDGHDSPGMRSGGGLESAAVDPSTGDLYAAWQDARFRSDGANDIVVSESTDGGKTWGDLVKANPDGSGSGLDHVTPSIAANGGFVHVGYFARPFQNGQYSSILTRRYVHSEDGGATFGGELKLGSKIDLTWAAVAGGKFLGDYTGMAASPGKAHDVWCRSSKPPKQGAQYHQTAWSATVVK